MATLRFGRFELRTGERQLRLDGAVVPLGSRAFDLLAVLVERRERVVAKDELLDSAWGGLIVEENNLSVQIAALRKVVGHTQIVTVNGRGYRFAGQVEDVPANAPAPAPAPARPRGNLPDRLQPLYGRDDDLALLEGLCRASTPVTLCGAGGIGKTCLAVTLARRVSGDFDGAWVVELAGVRDGDLVVPAVAQCLGLALPTHAPPPQALADALRSRSLLLVLDNCEHLLADVSRLVRALTDGAPGVHVLATSQEALKVPGERVHRLGPLSVPPVGSREPAMAYGAVQLFIERVRAHLGEAPLSADELGDAVAVCRQLDGIALAIELAAARVPLLGVAGVRNRLGDSLRWLATSAPSASARHRTLRAALAWSHDLLDPSTQVVLRRLGPFSGGFSLEGAQRIAGDVDGESIEVLDHLATLVDRSLVVREPGGRPRYRMLEPMREFALGQLEAAGEAIAWHRRHAHATRDICRLATRERDSPWLWAEMSNARAALEWALQTPGEEDVAVAIATDTAVVLATSGPVPEAMRNLLRVQPLLDDRTPRGTAARYWQWLGRFGIDGRLPTSLCIEALERAAAMFEAMPNWRHVHACRRMLAEACMRSGDLSRARAQLGAAEAIETAEGPPADRMRRLRVAGLIADTQGRHDEALRLVQHALDIAETHGIARYRLLLAADVGWILLHTGQADAAAARLRDVVTTAERNPREGLTRAHALAGLLAALVAGGRLADARDVAPAAVAALRGSGTFLVWGDVFAWLAAASGHPRVAARLLVATEAFHARGETCRDAVCEQALQQATRLVTAALGPREQADWGEPAVEADEALLEHLLLRAVGPDPAD